MSDIPQLALPHLVAFCALIAALLAFLNAYSRWREKKTVGYALGIGLLSLVTAYLVLFSPL
jgi:uncharacterized membrane protein HdeD (DUF308 family)